MTLMLALNLVLYTLVVLALTATTCIPLLVPATHGGGDGRGHGGGHNTETPAPRGPPFRPITP